AVSPIALAAAGLDMMMTTMPSLPSTITRRTDLARVVMPRISNRGSRTGCASMWRHRPLGCMTDLELWQLARNQVWLPSPLVVPLPPGGAADPAVPALSAEQKAAEDVGSLAWIKKARLSGAALVEGWFAVTFLIFFSATMTFSARFLNDYHPTVEPNSGISVCW